MLKWCYLMLTKCWISEWSLEIVYILNDSIALLFIFLFVKQIRLKANVVLTYT